MANKSKLYISPDIIEKIPEEKTLGTYKDVIFDDE